MRLDPVGVMMMEARQCNCTKRVLAATSLHLSSGCGHQAAMLQDAVISESAQAADRILNATGAVNYDQCVQLEPTITLPPGSHRFGRNQWNQSV